MKNLIILLFLLPQIVFANGAFDRFVDNKCAHSHQANWYIVAKLDENIYEIYFESIGPFKSSGRSILSFNSTVYNAKGIINDLIFVKVVEAIDLPTKDGFKRKADLLKESDECKKIWLEHEYHEDTESFPRLGEEYMAPLRKKDLEKQASIQKEKSNKLKEKEAKETARAKENKSARIKLLKEEKKRKSLYE